MRFALISIAISTLFALSACENKPQQQAASPKSSQDPVHAKVGCQSNSNEDWCDGHQVPESLCTRCNPSLIPAFKATGDWCSEHGLPESQCLICNPNLKIERPSGTGGSRP